TFCDWYLEFSKPVLEGKGAMADETRATTGWVLNQILILLNPFMPFITEELAARPAGKKLISSAWPAYAPGLHDAKAAAEIGWLMRVIGEIRSVRADMNVPAGAKVALQVKGAGETTKQRLKTYDEIIRRMARTETVTQG
ncbi:MAG TPA: valine--tRNA ligase, partial [Rhodospirillaceae bacterium]|nr:valine--tRNA ligase [Rhodospirillaceae bacterium]